MGKFETEERLEDTDEYCYKQDEYGRPSCASGFLHLEQGVRNPQAQLEAGGEWRRETDEGGHLIGTRFAGSGELENLVPENSGVNRSGFKALENEWAAELEDGNDVYVEVEPVYQDGTERPHVIMGKYDITDAQGETEENYFSFTNENLGLEEFDIPEENE